MSKKQINMAAVAEVVSGVAADNAIQNAQASSAAEVREATVTAKEAPVLSAIVSSPAFTNVAALSKVKGVDAKSVPGIVASLGKKGFVAAEPSFMGTLYVATEAGAEAAELLK